MSLHTQIILGVLISFPTLVLSIPASTSPPSNNETINNQEECRIKVEEQKQILKMHMKKEFPPEKFEEASRLYNGSKCVYCRYLCSKVNQVLSHTGDYLDSMSDLSNKTRIMVPLLKDLVERGLPFFCDNDAEMYSVYADVENSECFRESNCACQLKLTELDDPVGIFFCDSTNSKDNLDTPTSFCRYVLDFLECMKSDVSTRTTCSAEVTIFIDGLMTVLRNAESCAT